MNVIERMTASQAERPSSRMTFEEVTAMAQQQPARAFIERAFDDFVAAMSLPMVVLGDRLGLYKAMAGAGPLTSAELAARTGTAERYVREWLSQQAAGGYVAYDGATGRFALPDEHAAVLADETSPMFLGGAFQLAFGYAHSARHVQHAFRTGTGVAYDHQDQDVFTGVERFYLPASRREQALRSGDAARRLAEWRDRVRTRWGDVRVEARLESSEVEASGDPVEVVARVKAPGWKADELAVEVVYSRASDALEHRLRVEPMLLEAEEDGFHVYRARFAPKLSGRLAYGVRAYPVNDALHHAPDAHAVTWASARPMG